MKKEVLILTLIAGLIGCSSGANMPTAKPKQQQVQGPELTLNNAILEESNSKGQTLWKIQAEKSVYNQPTQIAHLETITGNLYQDGEIILDVSALSGEVKQKGEVIFLKGNIVVKDKRNGAVFKTKELEWYPKEGVLNVKKDVRGSHPQLEISADEGKYYTRPQHLQLKGNIVATSIEEKIQLKTEQLFWQLKEEKMTGDKPLQIVRYQNNTVIDKIVAEKLSLNLKAHQAQLEKNIELNSLEPPIKLATNLALWNYRNRWINIPVPLEIVNIKEKLTLNANQGKVNLVTKVANLKGGVKADSQIKGAQIYAQRLVWLMNEQKIEANGKVIYQQQEPKMLLKGEYAVGKFQDNSIVVNGNEQNKVVTEIIP